jgi:hypothetical protein
MVATPPQDAGAHPRADAATITEGEEPRCPKGQKFCGGLCAEPQPAIGCGLDDCAPCEGVERGGIVCEGTACSQPLPLTLEDLPIDEGCPVVSDAKGLPPPPIAEAHCEDPVKTDPTKLERGCCFYGCYQGHHYYSCLPQLDYGDYAKLQAACRASGMKLAEISDHYENEYVAKWGVQHGFNGLTIGLNTMDDPNVWRWNTLDDNKGTILFKNGVQEPGSYSALWPEAFGGHVHPCTNCFVGVSGYLWGGFSPMFTPPFVCESVD